MKQNDFEFSSRQLAYLLRHSEGICRLQGGWVSIADAMRHTRLKRTVIMEIVKDDKKGRFEINTKADCVRALYGHSVNVEMGYEEVAPPRVLLHGTDRYAADKILQEGLNTRSRQYVHLTDNMDMAFDVGSRHGEVVVLGIDAERMQADGIKFYNPVRSIWLTSSVPTQYIKIFGRIQDGVDDIVPKGQF